MYKDRLLKAPIMCGLWGLIVLELHNFLDIEGMGMFDAFLMWIIMILGTMIYLGASWLIAGYNTMPAEKKQKFNIYELTGIIGPVIVLYALIMHMVAICFYMNEFYLGATGLISSIVALISIIVWVNYSERFKMTAQEEKAY